MPIRCLLDIQPLTPDRFEEIDYRVVGHAFASQNRLGRLCEEAVYQRDLRARLVADGFRAYVSRNALQRSTLSSAKHILSI